MNKSLSFLAKIRYVFISILICFAIAHTRSSGETNFKIWAVGIFMMFIFLILWAIDNGYKRQNRLFIRIAFLIELIAMFISSLLMGGDDINIGYADENSVTFLGKTYAYHDPSHKRISDLVNAIFTIWSFAFFAILLTILISIFLKHKTRENPYLNPPDSTL